MKQKRSIKSNKIHWKNWIFTHTLTFYSIKNVQHQSHTCFGCPLSIAQSPRRNIEIFSCIWMLTGTLETLTMVYRDFYEMYRKYRYISSITNPSQRTTNKEYGSLKLSKYMDVVMCIHFSWAASERTKMTQREWTRTGNQNRFFSSLSIFILARPFFHSKVCIQ